MGSAALLAGALAVTGCHAQAYTCQSSAQCSGGACQPTGYCSFPDPACESGQRYGEFSGQGLGGQCVEPEPGTSSGPGPGSTSSTDPESSSTTTQAEATSSSGEETTTASRSDGTSTSAGEGTTTGGSESSATGPEPIDPSLIAWWRLDDDPADGVLDSTLNGLDGVCEVCPQLAPAVIDGGLAFTGEEVVQVAESNAFVSDAFTIAAWVRVGLIAPSPSFHHFVGKPVGPTNRNTFELFLANTTSPLIRFNVANATTFTVTQAPAPPLDVWTHMAGTYDGEIQRFYVDGELVDEDIGPDGGIAWDDNPVVMGGDIDGGELRTTFVGTLDDVRFYDRVLDGVEIAALASGQ